MPNSIAENPWVRLLLGPALAIIIVGFGIFYNDRNQDKNIEENRVALSKLSSVADELPLLRQALEKDNELVGVVLETAKRDIQKQEDRLNAFIKTNGDRERALEQRIRELERHEHSNGRRD